MSDSYLPVIAGAAIITYLTRIAGLSLGARTPPPMLRVFLSYVPIAAFAALAAPGIFTGDSDMLPMISAGIAAAFVVIRFGSLWLCLAAGMAVYWLSRTML